MQVGPSKVKSFGGFLRNADARCVGPADEPDAEEAPHVPPQKLVLDTLLGGAALTGTEIDQQIDALDRDAVEHTLRELSGQGAVTPIEAPDNGADARFAITPIGRRAASYFEITR